MICQFIWRGKKGAGKTEKQLLNLQTIVRFYLNVLVTKVRYWQTINEQNVMALAGSVIGTSNKTMKEKFQENHHMLVAQALVTKNFHERAYPGKIGPAPNIASVYPS